ncbi:hypothetical protein [Streptomyces sp. NRRL B-1347]|uniref:hypothetical protein n=1 Tax=Streptomyces sp. NRRL B-1347 TaxID=1476877 RepID=UPI00068F15C1|nr:hypothetical protein [Streptomyces sp. NRRL B-1347]
MAAVEHEARANDRPRATAPPPALAPWSEALTCYSAALAAWLAVRERHWWRPLLAGGPVLGVSAADDLFLFQHHARPLLPDLGLVVRWSDRWRMALDAQREQLARHGAVVVCGDARRLPWQRAHGQRHGPHWFTLLHSPDGIVVEDALGMTTESGQQRPHRVPVDAVRLEEWSRALPGAGDPVHWLRERSIAGTSWVGRGARYRWLEVGTPPPTDVPLRPLTGAAAVHALAERVRADGARALHRQADDLWQALRQRELLLAAARQDGELLDEAARTHWERATGLWRRLPRIMLRSRLRADAAPGSGSPSGPARPTGADSVLLDALAALAGHEGRHLVHDAVHGRFR